VPDNQSNCAASVHDCEKEQTMSKQTKQKYTILYERLSREDARSDDSLSIQNQRDFLENYAEQNGLKPWRHVQDDGYSGTQWTRPGWQELITEIEADKVSAVVVKNLDRVGRDYLRVGLFMEQLRDAGVRLICVSDGIDTANGVEDDFTPFRAILAEWYAKDCSKKIRAIFNSRMSQGYHCTGSIPYGYVHNPENHQEWLLDETAAAVVRQIFQLVIDGKGVYQIANMLTTEKVLIPSAYMQSIGEHCTHNTYADSYAWRGGVVSTILQRREYMGMKILKKTYSESYKQKKRKDTPTDEQITFEGAIPQIVDNETWELAQKLRRVVRRPAKDGRPPSPLTGLLVCADCGKLLTHARNADYRTGKEKNEYVCGNYRQGTKNCTMHYVRANVIEDLILKAIQRVAGYVKQNETEFVERVREASNLQAEVEVKESKKRLTKSERRVSEIDKLVTKLYETYALGKLPENHFERMLAEYDAVQTELFRTIVDLQTAIDDYAADSVRADKFIEIVRKYTEFPELNATLLNEFVEKVVIYEADKSSGKRVQKVEIHLSFIGNFDVPIDEVPLTPEQIEAERKADERRAKNSARQREYRAKKKTA
jgi:DNA invertase Pin-like site-specific DNA recombinase